MNPRLTLFPKRINRRLILFPKGLTLKLVLTSENKIYEHKIDLK
jgi:hypothetical protein